MRVGTSDKGINPIRYSWDHPHACGDKSQARRYEQRYIGSSPCVWGQAPTATARKTQLRIIPMRVGTSYPAVCRL